jgi:hypothetical protein
MGQTHAIPAALLPPRRGLDKGRIRLPSGPLRYALLLLIAAACALAGAAIRGPGDARAPVVAVAPPPAIVVPSTDAEGSPAAAVPEAGDGSAPGAKVPRAAGAPLAYLPEAVSLGARRALNSVATAIVLAPRAFPAFETHCTRITPILASVAGQTMAGNFRDSGGSCYVWINLTTTAGITGAELCKLSLHELGHLAGYPHVADVADVMHSPFVSTPIPPACADQPGALRAARKAAG